jgi:SAM-dependent MidA family methyltransferase
MPIAAADSNWPAPDDAQRAHSARLLAAFRVRLAAAGGWLPFDAWVQHALYAPGLGYYSAGARKFGAGGDFITAPELSPLFAGCIARQFAAAQPGEVILELGAGSGALACDLLRRLQQLQALPRQYLILEVSADLRQRQRQRVAELPAALAARVSWLDGLPAQPLRGLLLANEVADALPFKRVRISGGRWQELGVALDAQGKLQWLERAPDALLQDELDGLFGGLEQPELPDGYTTEICLALAPWLSSLAAAVGQGALLLIDYGLGRNELYHPSRSAGTLRCHYRHRAHDDPFLHAGLTDITHWVDFTRVAEAASDAGLEVAGYCTQAAFLLAGGLEQELAQSIAAAATPQQAAQRRGEAQRLLLPGEMGETFKAMLLMRGETTDWSGFGLQDLRRLL